VIIEPIASLGKGALKMLLVHLATHFICVISENDLKLKND